jgi:hypothetical protein
MPTPDLSVVAAVAAAVLILLAVPFVAAPVRVRWTSWLPAGPTYTPDDETGLPAEARDIAADLRDLGFDDRGTWRLAGLPLATGRFVLLEHPRSLDTAKVLVVTAGGRVAVTLVFQTRFAGGTEVVTANNQVTVGLPLPSDVTPAWLPGLRDPAALYRVHADLRDAVGPGRRLPIGPDPAGLMRAELSRTHDGWVESGYYWRDEPARVLRPTWKGAVLVTWRLLWPVKPLFRARRRRATRDLLARYGVTLEG